MSDEDYTWEGSEAYKLTDLGLPRGLLIHQGHTMAQDGTTIAHGMAAAPVFLHLTASAGKRNIGYASLGATNFTVKLWEWNEGSEEVGAGVGYADITHGLSTTPTGYSIAPQSARITFHISNEGASTFRVNLIDESTGAAPAGAVDVYWRADCAVSSTEDVQWIAYGDYNGPFTAPT